MRATGVLGSWRHCGIYAAVPLFKALTSPLTHLQCPLATEAGGEVHLMGKPAAIIYKEAARLLQLQPGQLLAIGDSLEHDVAGAQSIGVDTLFVLGGIHAADAGLEAASGQWDDEKLQQLSTSYGVEPTYAVSFMAL